MAGCPVLLGPVGSEMTPTIGAAYVVTLGKSNHVLLSRRSLFRCVVYALRRLREALSVKESAKAAADGVLQARIPHGPCLSVMILTTVVEVASTSGFSIVPR